MPATSAQKRTDRAKAKTKLAAPPRRSARLQEALPDKADESHHLPSPSTSPSPKSGGLGKRKRSEFSDVVEKPFKRTRAVQDTGIPQDTGTSQDTGVSQDIGIPQDDLEDQPILCWIRTGRWPSSFGKAVGVRMSQENSGKRKSSSTHHSDRLSRLAENGIYMRGSAMLQRSSKDFCDTLLEGSRVPAQCPCYPPEKVPEVLERVHELNEFRLQRDVMPWIVPSPENLVLSGESATPAFIGEEVQADWTRCITIGSTRPRPDFAIGLRKTAFTLEEIERLENYATPEQPFSFTPTLYFPFLMCEAKTGLLGMELADRQNIHSASIAVRAIIRLAEAAYGKDDARVKELYGKVLIFTVSHNNRVANLYGHYAVANENRTGGLEFFRHDIDISSLTMYDGRDRYRAYNFVRNVYEKFAPQHLERIQTAARCLPTPEPRTGRAFAASDSELNEGNSQPDSQQASQEGVFRVPGEPASSIKVKSLERQLEQQRKESKEQVDRLLQQMERQREENKEREARLERQLEKQMEKMMELMASFQPKRDSAREPS